MRFLVAWQMLASWCRNPSAVSGHVEATFCSMKVNFFITFRIDNYKYLILNVQHSCIRRRDSPHSHKCSADFSRDSDIFSRLATSSVQVSDASDDSPGCVVASSPRLAGRFYSGDDSGAPLQDGQRRWSLSSRINWQNEERRNLIQVPAV